MATPWVSYDEVKKAVSLDIVLARYGVALRRVNKSSLRGKCPLPTHGSEDSKNSFGAQLDKNAWACQSRSCVAARGRRGGNVLDFVAVMEGCSIRDAALKLQEWFMADGAKPALNVPPPPPQQTSADENKPLTFTLRGVDSSHPWVAARGISEETARTFGVGYFPGRGMMAGRVVIPIHNVNGDLVAYAGRALDDATEPRYLLPAGFNKTHELYNVHRAVTADESRGVVVVEGFFDAMNLHHAGFPTVVALMGTVLSEKQAKLIAENFSRAIVMLDGDEAGCEALPRIVTHLAKLVDVRVAKVPSGAQPDSMTEDAIRELLNPL